MRETFEHQIVDHLTSKRYSIMQQEFINELRKRILMKKILKSFRTRNELDMKRAILVEFVMNARNKIRHRDDIDNRVEYVEYETNTELLQIAFNCLKERVVIKKFSQISLNCHRLKSLRKYFSAL